MNLFLGGLRRMVILGMLLAGLLGFLVGYLFASVMVLFGKSPYATKTCLTDSSRVVLTTFCQCGSLISLVYSKKGASQLSPSSSIATTRLRGKHRKSKSPPLNPSFKTRFKNSTKK